MPFRLELLSRCLKTSQIDLLSESVDSEILNTQDTSRSQESASRGFWDHSRILLEEQNGRERFANLLGKPGRPMTLVTTVINIL